MKKLMLMLTIVCFFAAMGSASAVTIDFNDGTAGNTVGNFYSGLGVTFTNAGWNDPISNQSGTPSDGIFLVDSTAGWNPPYSPSSSTPIIGTFSSEASYLSLLAVDIGFNGIRMDVYDSEIGGTLLGTDSFVGEGAGVGTYYSLTFSDPSIRRFEVYLIEQNNGDGIFFDNLEFTSASVPEPATMVLLGTGLFGLALFRRKKSQR